MKNLNQIEQFVIDYKSCRTKSAQSVIAQASICYDAKSKLINKSDYAQFCDEIREKPNSSYLKKLHCIASKKSRFEAVIETVPPCYSALYLLSQFDDITFQQLIADNRIHSALKLKDIRALNSSHTKPASSVPPARPIRVTIEISDLKHLQAFNAELSQLKQKYAYLKIDDKPVQQALKQQPALAMLPEPDSANDVSVMLSAA